MAALLGRNGAGKSTLLRCLSGVLVPDRGEVPLQGQPPAHAVSRQEIARILAVVPQAVTVPFSFTVREMVALGRTPHIRPLTRPDRTTTSAVVGGHTGTTGSGATWPSSSSERLSAGEQQRVAIGMALAQEPRCCLLDEPTAHLDVAHQLEILGLLGELHRAG